MIELIINLATAIAMFVALLGYFVEKAIQLTLVIMAYIFAPFFLVAFTSPDTARGAENFVRIFVEACIWNFVWSGLTALFWFIRL